MVTGIILEMTPVFIGYTSCYFFVFAVASAGAGAGAETEALSVLIAALNEPRPAAESNTYT